MSQGWMCPVCGRGLSPSVAVCPCNGTGPSYEYSNTANPIECEHVWATYNGTVPFRQCTKCMKTEYLPVTP